MKKTILILAIALASCTRNDMARNFGGKETIILKPDEVLMNITWKESDMWILTTDTITGWQYFREKSSNGVWEGQITLRH